MSDKNQIPWFEGNKNTLKKASNHHAYIFEGPKGIGKKSFTLEVAKGFLCKTKQNIEINYPVRKLIYESLDTLPEIPRVRS